MKIYAISDLHGNLPLKRLGLPECDLLLIAGDIGPWHNGSNSWKQSFWFQNEFKMYLDELSRIAKNIVCIPGNHDFSCECDLPLIKDALKPYWMLHDGMVEIEGLKIFGTAWQPWFNDWAFNCTDDEAGLGKKYSIIPEGLDILITHNPPHGICDRPTDPEILTRIEREGRDTNLGSVMLRDCIKRVKPKVNVCGHIHSANGCGLLESTKVYNVSLLNEQYKMVYAAKEIIF